MTSLVEDDREIICHHMLVPCCRSDRDLIKGHPIFGVLLAVVFFELLELEIAWPDDLSEMRGELF